jgi:RsiW-degrading membrane proteinase PrsW (M82 family)
MNWLILAIAPGIAISLYIIFKDQYNREPRKHLIISFLLGILAIFPALIIESIFNIADEFTFFHTIQGIGIKAFFFVALVEEFCKFIMLRFYAYRKPEFDEPFDGIVYAVMVGMGFATLENIFYVSQYGMVTGVFRMFLAIPAHATFAIAMGYFTGLAKFNREKRFSYLIKGLIVAILMHGFYDFLLMQKNFPQIAIGAFASVAISVYFSMKAIRLHQEISPHKIVYKGWKKWKL